MLSWRARHHDHGILYGASGRSQSTRTTDTSNRVGRRRCHWRRCTNTAACCYRRCRLLRRRSKHTILHFQLLTPLSVLSSQEDRTEALPPTILTHCTRATMFDAFKSIKRCIHLCYYYISSTKNTS